MKKQLAILAAILFSSPAFPAVNLPSTYIGVGITHDNGAMRRNEIVASTNVTRDPDRSSGMEGELHIGTVISLAQGFVGMSMHADMSNSSHDVKAIGSTSNHKTSEKLSFGASITPGLTVSAQQLFLRLGYQITHFHYTSTDSAFSNLHYNVNRPGLITGVGIRAPISSHFAISQEYRHTFFKSFQVANANDRLSLKPSNDTYWLSLDYFFDDQMKNTDRNEHPIYDGFYAGLGLGQDMGSLEERRENSPSYVIYRLHGSNGPVARALLGYQMTIEDSPVKIATELGASLSKAKYQFASATAPADNYQQTLDRLISLRGRIGYLTQPSNEIFLGAGGAFAHFKKTGGESRGTNYSKWKPGIVLFIGDEVELTDHLSLGLEWDYMRFRKIEPNKTSGGVLFTWKPVVERALLSLVYEF